MRRYVNEPISEQNKYIYSLMTLWRGKQNPSNGSLWRNPTVIDGVSSQRAVNANFIFYFFFPSPIKLLIQQSYCRWFDMSRRSCDVSVMGSTCCCRKKGAKIKPSVRGGYQKDQWCEKHPLVKPPSCCLCTGCRVWLRQIYIAETNVNWVQFYICSWNISLTWF